MEDLGKAFVGKGDGERILLGERGGFMSFLGWYCVVARVVQGWYESCVIDRWNDAAWACACMRFDGKL